MDMSESLTTAMKKIYHKNPVSCSYHFFFCPTGKSAEMPRVRSEPSFAYTVLTIPAGSGHISVSVPTLDTVKMSQTF